MVPMSKVSELALHLSKRVSSALGIRRNCKVVPRSVLAQESTYIFEVGAWNTEALGCHHRWHSDGESDCPKFANSFAKLNIICEMVGTGEDETKHASFKETATRRGTVLADRVVQTHSLCSEVSTLTELRSIDLYYMAGRLE